MYKSQLINLNSNLVMDYIGRNKFNTLVNHIHCKTDDVRNSGVKILS